MPQSETLRIAGQLKRAVAGPAWHGPSLLESIDGVTASQAAARPLSGAHSIHELVAHATAWLDIVRQRLERAAPSITEEMNWPPTSADDWPRARARLEESVRRLDGAIRSLDDAALSDELRNEDERWSVYDTLHGVIQHALYHAGQIGVLKKGLS